MASHRLVLGSKHIESPSRPGYIFLARRARGSSALLTEVAGSEVSESGRQWIPTRPRVAVGLRGGVLRPVVNIVRKLEPQRRHTQSLLLA